MSNDRGIMAGRVTGRWQKFPKFIEYANDGTTFQRKTEATLTRARWLAGNDLVHSRSLVTEIPKEKSTF
jgi:hypothetical protein